MDDPTPSSPSFDVLPPDRLSEEPGAYRVNASEGLSRSSYASNGVEIADGAQKGQEEAIALDYVPIVGPDGVALTKAQRKEAVRLAYASGQGSLSELSVRYGFLYQTVRLWSSDEKWSEGKEAMTLAISTEAQREMAKLIAKEQVGQVRRALERSLKVQSAVDTVLTKGDVYVDKEGGVSRIPLGAKSLQAIAMTEERLDLIIRRNLGMEESNGQAGKISVNVLSGNVQIASL